jgi:hypothetical protein
MQGSRTPNASQHRAAFAALAIVVALLALRATQRTVSDFAVFHAAGARFAAGAPLYDPAQETPYRYAPGVAALFAPFAAVRLEVAKVAWIGLTAALVLLVSFALSRKCARGAPLAVPLAWACLLQPLAQEMAHGQVDVLVLALAVGAFSADDADRPWLAGVLVALATALKVAPVVLAADWVLRRRWRALGGCVAGALATGALLVPRYGIAGAWEQHMAWIWSQSADAGVMIGTIANQSAWAWARSVGLGAAGGVLAVAAILVLVLTDPRHARRRELLLAIVPLVSAYGWPQLFVLAVPMVASTIALGGAAAWLSGGAAAAVTLLSYDVAGPRAEGWAQGHRVLGLLLLLSVLAARAARRLERRAAPSRS